MAHSDIQRSPLEKKHYETAIADILENFLTYRRPRRVTWCTAGTTPACITSGLPHPLRSGIPWWFEIAGNHDQNDIACI